MRVWLCALVMGCGGKLVVDGDGDGFDSRSDCDDTDKTVHPQAVEICDGLDNDCDYFVDEDGVDGYPDTDNDGYGELGSRPTRLCDVGDTLPVGYAPDATDCDDADADTHPGAVEDCDPVDRNCDDDPIAGAPLTWYRDTDGDSFGADDISYVGCTGNDGYVTHPGDCDDGDAAVSPVADEIDCNGVDEDCDDEVDEPGSALPSWYPDADDDGYGDPAGDVVYACVRAEGTVADATDCDDADATVHPGAVDRCNGGIDDDCDPATDEAVVSADALYADGDGDGFGAGAASGVGCPSAGLSATDDDCDDVDPDVNPGADELCGGVDEDCDGAFDVGAADAPIWYEDVDGDGFGDPATAIASCTGSPVWVSVALDCDDFDGDVHPGAPELCNAGIDDDCDPSTVDDDAATRPTWYPDADRDLHGDPAGGVVVCAAPMGSVLLGDDCDDNDPDRFPGNPDVCDDLDNDCDPSTDEELSVVWYQDADGDGFGDPAVSVNGCDLPPGFVADPGDCDDTDATLNPTRTPGCVLTHCGVIAAAQTWTATVLHRITCDVSVEGLAKPTLTIEDGAEVQFDAGTGLEVGNGGEGKLVVQGTALGVLFTASAAGGPGSWDGLTLGTGDRGSSLVGLTVEQAGGNGEAGVVIEGGDPTLDRLVSRDNLGNGVKVTGSEPLIHDCELTGNTDDGLYVASGAGLARTPALGGVGPSLTDCLVTDNRGRPVTIPGSHADELAPSSLFALNDTDQIQLLTGTLRFGGTWLDHGMPYVVADGNDIDVEDGPAAQLTVADGVEVQFGAGASLRVGDGAGGKLIIPDGPLGVVFTGSAAVIAQSTSWDGVLFGADDAGSDVRNLLVAYGGGNGKGNLWVSGSHPTFTGVTSQNADTSGLYVSGAAARPVVRDSRFEGNDQHGVYVDTASHLGQDLLGSTFTGNVLTGNGASPITLPPDDVGELDATSSFSGNVFPIAIHAGSVTEDAVWMRLDEDYHALGDITVGGPQDPVLELEDEVVIAFEPDAALNAGTSDDGALIVDATLGVLLTSADPNPGEGDWDGVALGRNGAVRPQSSLRGVTVSYAGGANVGDGGAIELVDRDACSSREPWIELQDLTIVASSKAALWAEAGTWFSAVDFTMTGSLGGCWDLPQTNNCLPQLVDAFTNNDCVGGTVWGTWPLPEVDALDASSTYPGPVVVESTALTTSVTMPALPVDYELTGLVAIAGPDAPVLTVPGAATLTFAEGAGFTVGVSAAGGLVIEPGALLTSALSPRAPGDWAGIRIGSNCNGIDLQGATVEYAGDNAKGALWIENCDVGVVDGDTFASSSTCGVKQSTQSMIVLGPTTYAGNLGGDYCIY